MILLHRSKDHYGSRMNKELRGLSNLVIVSNEERVLAGSTVICYLSSKPKLESLYTSFYRQKFVRGKQTFSVRKNSIFFPPLHIIP